MTVKNKKLTAPTKKTTSTGVKKRMAQPPYGAVLPAFAALLLLLFLYVFLITRGWLGGVEHGILLRRRVNLTTLKGVRERHRTRSIRLARHLLCHGGKTDDAALLYLDGDVWVVCRGSELTVESTTFSHGTVVEFCAEHPPAFRITPAVEDRKSPPPLTTALRPSTNPQPNCPPRGLAWPVSFCAVRACVPAFLPPSPSG